MNLMIISSKNGKIMCYNTERAAIGAAIAALDGDWTDFEGMNCNDYLDADSQACFGWDGESHRCHCSNRRVQWATSQNEKGLWSAYAEAY